MTNNRAAGDHAPRDTTAQPVPDAGSAGPGPSGKKSKATGASRKSRARRKAASRPGARAWRGVPAAPAGTADQVTGPRPGTPQRVVRVGSPASLLALVPQLLGFEPRDSIVVMGVAPPRGRVQITLRFDLHGVSNPGSADVIARHLLSILAAQGFKAGVAVGYGSGSLVTPVADALRACAARIGLRLTELLRAQDGRYWSYLCTEPACCPADGVPYEVASHPVTAAFAAAGAPPVLADRAELVASVAALDGAAGESMQEATRLAEERASRLITEMTATGRKGAARRLIATAGLAAVSAAITGYAERGELAADADAAWLSLVLRDLRVRDDAWSRMEPEHSEMYLRLWTDLTRRARPGYVAPVASLLAFAAWQCGNGALANIALERALADDPRYSMARLLRGVLDAAVPPRLARLPMTPQDVAASYAASYGDPADDDPGEGGSRNAGEDGPEFGDADFGDPDYDDYEAGADQGEADDEEIARQG
jgi:Domain of unknown function (DUF4192)